MLMRLMLQPSNISWTAMKWAVLATAICIILAFNHIDISTTIGFHKAMTTVTTHPKNQPEKDLAVPVPPIGKLLQPIPNVAFFPHPVMDSSNRLELWNFNRPQARSAYMRFIPKSTPNRTDEYVFIHVHKGGGTSLKMAHYPPELFLKADVLYSLYRSKHPAQFDSRVNHWISRCNSTANDDLSATATADAPFFFSFVRDPAVKFLSGVGQILANVHGKSNDNLSVLMPCFRSIQDDSNNVSNILSMLHCVLDKMITKPESSNGTWTNTSSNLLNYFDMHTLPQVFELYNGILDHDNIPIYLMDLSSLDSFFQVCNATPPLKQHARSTTTPQEPASATVNTMTITTDTTSNNEDSYDNATVHRRLKRWKLPILSPIVLYAEDPTLLRRVCSAYDMDVEMLQILKQKGLVIPTLCY
jgi:hypothetical protein